MKTGEFPPWYVVWDMTTIAKLVMSRHSVTTEGNAPWRTQGGMQGGAFRLEKRSTVLVAALTERRRNSPAWRVARPTHGTHHVFPVSQRTPNDAPSATARRSELASFSASAAAALALSRSPCAAPAVAGIRNVPVQRAAVGKRPSGTSATSTRVSHASERCPATQNRKLRCSSPLR